jgi:hypothetical protein
MNRRHQFHVYVDDVNLLGADTNITMGNTEALLVASMEASLELNADKACADSYVHISSSQTTEQNHYKSSGS